MTFLTILAQTVALWLGLISSSMMLRALLPLVFDMEGSVFYGILCLITEPWIYPVRVIFYHLNIGQDSPVDMSFFTAYLLLVGVRMFLPVL